MIHSPISSSSSSDTSWTDESASGNGDVHKVENFVVCSVARQEGGTAQVTRRFALDETFVSGLISGALFLELGSGVGVPRIATEESQDGDKNKNAESGRRSSYEVDEDDGNLTEKLFSPCQGDGWKNWRVDDPEWEGDEGVKRRERRREEK